MNHKHIDINLHSLIHFFNSFVFDPKKNSHKQFDIVCIKELKLFDLKPNPEFYLNRKGVKIFPSPSDLEKTEFDLNRKSDAIVSIAIYIFCGE